MARLPGADLASRKISASSRDAGAPTSRSAAREQWIDGGSLCVASVSALRKYRFSAPAPAAIGHARSPPGDHRPWTSALPCRVFVPARKGGPACVDTSESSSAGVRGRNTISRVLTMGAHADRRVASACSIAAQHPSSVEAFLDAEPGSAVVRAVTVVLGARWADVSACAGGFSGAGGAPVPIWPAHAPPTCPVARPATDRPYNLRASTRPH